MIRASNLYRICTNRPVNNIEDLNAAKNKLIEKVNSKQIVFSEEDIDTYLTTQGLMTVAKDYLSEKEKYRTYVKDELPIGAKTYMEELWLEINHGFTNISFGEEVLATKKGKLVEDDAISLVGKLYNLVLCKNTERVYKGFLTGEADVVFTDLWGDKVIRDNKSPLSWSSFRKKFGIPPEYYWQLIGYCYLYDARIAYIDYTFMPTPLSILDEMKERMGEETYQLHIQTNESILNLTPLQRVKTFALDTYRYGTIESEIEFMLGRLERCHEYFNNLTYEICMNIFEQSED